ncbi:MAG: zinc transporter ZupT [Clostridia bacterium]
MNVIFAFTLTLLAGLATGIGSAMVLLTRNTNKKFLSFSLGLSAGVMLYVSFVEILAKAVEALSEVYGDKLGNFYAVLGFFAGVAVIALIDKFMPKMGNPHEIHTVEEMDGQDEEHKTNLMRMGMFTAIAIGIHNFPEGLATFISALEDPSLGIAITVAIAIHNIPEGIAVAVPIFYATGSRKKAFKLSFLSGLSEPIGALVGYFLFIRFFGNETFGFIFAAVAGIMVYISLDELLPAAEEYGEHHIAIWGVIIGMIIMAISLLLFI